MGNLKWQEYEKYLDFVENELNDFIEDNRQWFSENANEENEINIHKEHETLQ